MLLWLSKSTLHTSIYISWIDIRVWSWPNSVLMEWHRLSVWICVVKRPYLHSYMSYMMMNMNINTIRWWWWCPSRFFDYRGNLIYETDQLLNVHVSSRYFNLCLLMLRVSHYTGKRIDGPHNSIFLYTTVRERAFVCLNWIDYSPISLNQRELLAWRICDHILQHQAQHLSNRHHTKLKHLSSYTRCSYNNCITVVLMASFNTKRLILSERSQPTPSLGYIVHFEYGTSRSSKVCTVC